MSRDPCHLRGLGVLITRPAHQADTLCELIEHAHGRPVRLAAIEIAAAPDQETARAQLAANCDILIFISANAVRFAYPLLPEALSTDLDIAAIGSATAKALEEIGLEPTLVPEVSLDSEGLLALPRLEDLAGQRATIVRGGPGRSALGDTLCKRGATVTYAEVYERRLPRRDTRNLVKGWSRMVAIVTATSNEALDNLFAMLGVDNDALLQHTPLVVVSQRMAEHARSRGCTKLHLARSALDLDLLGAVCELAADHSIKNTSIW